ncbi:MAG: nucleotidyltransferase domain-containing protein [Pseudomonadota bacterium]
MVYKRTQLKRIVADLVRQLERRANLPVDEVILFGSYAWGKPASGSDIDLAVISSKFRGISDIKRIEVLSDIARYVYPDWDIEIDVVGFTHDELAKAGYFDLAAVIKEKGKLIYKKAA